MKNLVEYILEDVNVETNDILDPIFNIISSIRFYIYRVVFGTEGSMPGMYKAKVFGFNVVDIDESYYIDHKVKKLKQKWESKGLEFREYEQNTNQPSFVFSFKKQNIIIVIYREGNYLSNINIYIEPSDKTTEKVIRDFASKNTVNI